MLSEKQLEERRSYIGGSDVGPILGYSKWRTPLDVYREKVEGEYIDLSDNPFVYNGIKREPEIREDFKLFSGLTVSLPASVKYHKEHAFLGANVDGIVQNGEAILEIKTVSPFARKGWGEPNQEIENKLGLPSSHNSGFKKPKGYVPDSYLFQCAHYCAIHEIDKAYLIVDFGTDMFIRAYQYDRDIELEKILIERLCAFWHNNVLKNIPPDPTNLKDITSLYSAPVTESTTVANMEILSKYEELKELNENKKALDEKIDDRKKKIMEFMKESETLLDINGEKMCSWKGYKTNRFDSTRFKKEHKELAGRYMNQTESRRFLPY